MYRLLALDVDGTLVNSHDQVTEPTRQADDAVNDDGELGDGGVVEQGGQGQLGIEDIPNARYQLCGDEGVTA